MKNMRTSLATMLILALCVCGCGCLAEGGVDLNAVLDEFALSDEMMTLTLTDLNDIYFMGIDEADVVQCAAAVHTSGINCDEIILIEAVDEEAAARVKTILDAHFQAQKDAMENYIPEEFAIMEQCSVTQDGNFVAMIVSPNADEYREIYSGYIQYDRGFISEFPALMV